MARVAPEKRFPDLLPYLHSGKHLREGVNMRLNDLIGQKFERLTVLSYSHSEKGQRVWNCQCVCGNKTKVITTRLKQGRTRSCGCIRLTHNMSKTKIYYIWKAMRNRCLNENDSDYKSYGGRGIKLCDKWKTLEGFLEDMGDTYKEGLTLEREDVNGGYSKENCHWGTWKEQNNNKRDTKYYTVNGETQPFTYFCDKYNIPFRTAKWRLRSGWNLEEVFLTPLKRKKK